MHKKDEKTARCTTFFSKKNRKTMTVYSDLARKAADAFEQDISIQGYEANLDVLDPKRTVEPKDIPQRYFDHAWSSDFLLQFMDGNEKIVEVVDEQELEGPRGKALCEKLELSRRYWQAVGVPAWGIIIMRKDGLEDAVSGT